MELNKKKVFDCFLFFNELDLLDLRLNTLDRYVDYFVIVESAITFQGDAKDFYFENNKSRFEKFKNKIIHFKVDQYSFDFANLPYIFEPNCKDEEILNAIYKDIDNCPHFDKQREFWWGNDFYQRECIRRALATAEPALCDLILISDVDEIPNPDIIEEIKNKINPNSLICLKQHEFCYYLNYFHNSNWIGTCCFIYGGFEKASLNELRFSSKRKEVYSPQIYNNGGWHFTSIGDVEAIKNKIKSWSHREYNTAATLNSVEYNVKYGYDIFRRPGFGKMEYLSVTSNIFPEYLVNNPEKFKKLIGPVIETEPIFKLIFYTTYFYLRTKIPVIFRRLMKSIQTI